MTKSFLDEIEGIGPARKRKLLNYFGSIKKIKEASKEELMKSQIPESVAENIVEFLKK